jgi:hypothetical protein
MNYYHYPIYSKFNFVFFRVGGPGLGNLMFPMYRAFQAANLSNGIFVFPTFFQFKIGPLLRREKDSRSYGDLFKSRRFNEVLLCLRVELNIIDSTFEDKEIDGFSNKSNSSVVLYEGMRNFFYDLDVGLRDDFLQFLKSRLNNIDLLEMSCKEILPDDVCIHIRGGDFSNEDSEIFSNKRFSFAFSVGQK